MESSIDYGSSSLMSAESEEVKPLGRKDIFWGVFTGLWAFGISYGIVALVVYQLIK